MKKPNPNHPATLSLHDHSMFNSKKIDVDINMMAMVKFANNREETIAKGVA